MALATLAGRDVRTSVFAHSDLVTPANVCNVNPAIGCADTPDRMANGAVIDAAAAAAFVRNLHETRCRAGFERLLPAVD